MRPVGGEFEVNDEVDELRWLSPEKAGKLLDYDHDDDWSTSCRSRHSPEPA